MHAAGVQRAWHRLNVTLYPTPAFRLPRRSAVGTTLSHEVTKRYGADGLPEGTIHIKLNG